MSFVSPSEIAYTAPWVSTFDELKDGVYVAKPEECLSEDVWQHFLHIAEEYRPINLTIAQRKRADLEKYPFTHLHTQFPWLKHYGVESTKLAARAELIYRTSGVAKQDLHREFGFLKSSQSANTFIVFIPLHDANSTTTSTAVVPGSHTSAKFSHKSVAVQLLSKSWFSTNANVIHGGLAAPIKEPHDTFVLLTLHYTLPQFKDIIL